MTAQSSLMNKQHAPGPHCAPRSFCTLARNITKHASRKLGPLTHKRLHTCGHTHDLHSTWISGSNSKRSQPLGSMAWPCKVRCCFAPKYNKEGYACAARKAKPACLVLKKDHYTCLTPPDPRKWPGCWLRDTRDQNLVIDLTGIAASTPQQGLAPLQPIQSELTLHTHTPSLSDGTPSLRTVRTQCTNQFLGTHQHAHRVRAHLPRKLMDLAPLPLWTRTTA